MPDVNRLEEGKLNEGIFEISQRVSENEKSLAALILQVGKIADQQSTSNTALAVMGNVQENTNQRIAALHDEINLLRDLKTDIAAMNERVKNLEKSLEIMNESAKRMAEQSDTQKFWIIMTAAGWFVTILITVFTNFHK